MSITVHYSTHDGSARQTGFGTLAEAKTWAGLALTKSARVLRYEEIDSAGLLIGTARPEPKETAR